MNIIGFAGQIASGKTSLAQHVSHKLGWEKRAFADALKAVYMNTFGVDHDFIEKWKRINEAPPKFQMTVRRALQFIGDGFRSIRNSIWIDRLFNSLGSGNYLIDDVRYVNEANAIKKHPKAFNVLLWRPGHENNDPNPSETELKPVLDWVRKHCKEGLISRDLVLPMDVQKFDFFFINDAVDMNALYVKIEEILIPAIVEYFNE